MSNFWKDIKKPTVRQTHCKLVGLAPMDGVTDGAMRYIFASIAKPDVIFTEQVSVEAIVHAFDQIKNRLVFTEIEKPIVVQLSGYDSEYYYKASKKVISLGFDGLDINLGCPVKALNKKGGKRGAGLIGEYNTVQKIILGVRKAINESNTNIPLSVKTRIGIDKPITKEWVGFLSKLPVDAIILHGRTWKQGYTGKADWQEIALGGEIAKKENKIFLGNGDIGSRGEAEEFCKQYGTDGVLIGRAACGNPWCFSNRNSITKQQRINTLLIHARYYEKTRGDRPFLEFRKHIGWYLKGFPEAKKLRTKLIQVKSLKEVVTFFQKYCQ